MRYVRLQQVKFGSLQSKKARALVAQMEPKKFRRKPLFSKILIATGSALALIIVGAMLSKIKNPTPEEEQKETPGAVQKNKNERAKNRIKQLKNVLKMRAKLKDKISWNTPEEDTEEQKEEIEKETELLEDRLARLQNDLEHLEGDIKYVQEEQAALFDKLLSENPITKETDSKYSRISAQLGDMHTLRGKTEEAIIKTDEKLEIEKTRLWLVGKDEEYLLSARHVAHQVLADSAFSNKAVLEAIRTIRVVDELLEG